MNAHSLAALLVRHSARLRAAAVAVACALVLLSACSLGSSGSNNSHACADKVAAATTGQNVGVWKCLDDGFQNTLKASGAGATDGSLVNTPFALTWHYVGSTGHASYYELILQPSVVAQVHANEVGLTVWTDGDGKVSNVGISSPVF